MQQLFTEFTETTAAQWKEQLIKDLKSTPYDSLIWKSNSGIDVKPFYTQEDLLKKPSPVFTKSDWAICEIIIVTDAKKANTQALNALQNGASGLVFYITKSTDYSVLLTDVLLQHIYSLFKVDASCYQEFSAFLSKQTVGANCFIECDTLLQKNHITEVTHTICIDTSIYQEAGANAINELSFSVAHLNEYLNEAHLKSSALLIDKIHISVSAGGDFFTEISKLRALRQLVYFLCNQYGINPHIHIHAQTTAINKSEVDSYNNMLRSTTEAMSASIGGADSILVLPFDYYFKESTDFSLRMARNQQLILKDESYLNMVADISAGSYYIETITNILSEKAWEKFKMIESEGGLKVGLASATIQDTIHKDAQQLINQFNEGSLVLVGVNKFKPTASEPVSENKKTGRITVNPNEYGIKAVSLG